MAIALTRLDPFFRSPTTTNFEKFFDDVVNEVYNSPLKLNRRGPNTNVIKTEEGHEISIVAPGLKKKDFSVTFNDGVLSISHEKKETSNTLSQSSFKYSWRAPRGVVGENISAKYDAGILTLLIANPADADQGAETIQVK